MSDKFTDEELLMEIGGPILDRICALRERANIYDTPREAEGDRAEADRQESALAEIRRRLAPRKVTREQVGRLVSDILEMPASGNSYYPPEFLAGWLRELGIEVVEEDSHD